MTENGAEMWFPRCPRCSESNIILAPANGFTKHLLPQVEVYCPNCQWREKLADTLKQIYVRT